MTENAGDRTRGTPKAAEKQLDLEEEERKKKGPGGEPPVLGSKPGPGGKKGEPIPEKEPRRFHGSVVLDATRVGRDAGQIADEIIGHLTGLPKANVTVTLEIEAEIPDGAPENVVRTVTENAQALKFRTQGFETE